VVFRFFGTDLEKNLIIPKTSLQRNPSLERGSDFKKILSIIIIVALSLALFSVLSISFVKADTSEAKVLSYSWYVAPENTVQTQYSGDLVAVGEIQNVGSNVLGYVYVASSAYDSSGNLLGTGEVQIFGNDVLPGQKAPFYLDFPPSNSATGDQSWVPSVTNVTVSVVVATDTTDTLYSGFTIPTSTVYSHFDSSGTYTVTGNVENDGNQAVGNVWVVTTFYNASGTVVALNYTNSLSTSIASGDSISFTASPMDNSVQLSSGITNYSFLIQSLPITTSTTSSPTPTATLPPSSSTPSTSTIVASPTQLHPTSVSLATLEAVVFAIVVVAVAVIVALMLLIMRGRHKKGSVESPIQPSPQP